MPTLILSPRYSDDSIRLRRAALALGWDVARLASWYWPDDLDADEDDEVEAKPKPKKKKKKVKEAVENPIQQVLFSQFIVQ